MGYGEPFDLEAGAGAAWVGYAHAVSRVDAKTGEVEQIRVGSSGAIGFGEEAAWAVGKLWFDSPQEISRIDTETRTVIQRIPPANVGAERALNEVAAGAGAVWAISEFSRRAWKVDPRIGRVSAVIPLYHGPVDIAIGEQAVWTVNDDGTVSRIDPKTATLARTIRSVGTRVLRTPFSWPPAGTPSGSPCTEPVPPYPASALFPKVVRLGSAQNPSFEPFRVRAGAISIAWFAH